MKLTCNTRRKLAPTGYNDTFVCMHSDGTNQKCITYKEVGNQNHHTIENPSSTRNNKSCLTSKTSRDGEAGDIMPMTVALILNINYRSVSDFEIAYTLYISNYTPVRH